MHNLFKSKGRTVASWARKSVVLSGLTAVSLAGFAAQADAALFIDLRFADTGLTTKDVSGLAPNTLVPVNIWARVIGADADPTNETFKSAYIGVRSTTENLSLLNADIVTNFPAALANTFSGTTYYTTTFTDQNVAPAFGERSSPADSTTDVGGPAINAVNGFLKPRSGATAANSTTINDAAQSHAATTGGVGWEWLLAQVEVNINSLGGSLPNSLTTALTLTPYNSTALPVTQLSSYGMDRADAAAGGVGSTGAFTVGSSVSFQVMGTGGGTNPDIDPTPVDINLGNLLRNAIVNTNVTLTNNGSASGTYTASPTGQVTINSGGTGTLANGATGTLSAHLDTTSNGTRTGTIVVSTPGDTDTAAVDTTTIHAIVGSATVGTAQTAAVAAGGSYVGLESDLAAGGGAVGTSSILDYGSNAVGGATTVSMTYRVRAANETAPTGTHPPLPSGASQLISDVVDLTGTAGDVFALQMSYQENLLTPGSNEAASAALGNIYLVSLINGTWDLAVRGNSNFSAALGVGMPVVASFASYQAGTASHLGAGTKTAGAVVLGDWGVDPAGNVVWAVLDHNSPFAAVPEPSSMALAGFGLVGLAGYGIRRRRRISK